jgi:hypothetical protein
MVLMSAVTPAPEEGSNPAMVRTTGGEFTPANLRKFGAVGKRLSEN